MSAMRKASAATSIIMISGWWIWKMSLTCIGSNWSQREILQLLAMDIRWTLFNSFWLFLEEKTRKGKDSTMWSSSTPRNSNGKCINILRIYPIIKCKTATSQPLPRVYHGATTIDNESIVVFGGKNINEKNTSFYVLKPKDIKLDLDIEEEDEFSGT